MSKAHFKQYIEAYFDFNFIVAGAIALGIFCLYLYLVWRKKKSQNQSVLKGEVVWGIMLSLYLAFLLGGTLLNRIPDPVYVVEIVPFWSYYKAVTSRDIVLFVQILCNILFFAPWGFLFPQVWERMRKPVWIIGSALVVSVTIELIQLIFHLGFFEFDDIFNNTLGALIGYGLWKLVSKYTRKAKLNE